MTFEPWDWQVEDVATLKNNNYTGLLAIEAGGTKTAISTMALAESKPGVALIVAPETTFNRADKNWPITVKEIAGREVRRIGNSTKAHREALTSFELGMEGVYVTTPQFLTRAETSLWGGDMVILDEIHQLATAKAKGQRKLSGYDDKDGEPLSRRFNHRLALSGTPMRQNFANMWSIMRFLWPDLDGYGEVAFDNFFMWKLDRMDWDTVYTNQKDRYGNTKVAKNFLRESEPGRLVSEMPCVVIHKRRERCCKHHPKGFLSVDKPQELTRYFELHPKQRKAIDEMEAHMMTWLEDNPLAADIPLVQKQRVRQMCLGVPTVSYSYTTDPDTGEEKEHSHIEYELECASPLVDNLLDVLADIGSEPVAVYLESQRFAEVLVHRLRKAGYRTEEYSGARKADLSRFGKDYQILVGITSAIGTGTDGLNEVCQTEIWAEVPVSATMQSQTEARLDRVGTPRQVQRWHLHDDEGYSEGRLGDLVEKRISASKSMRKVER